MLLYILVGLAGVAGALLRYGIGLFWEGSYPLDTFVINMAGSFALGCLAFWIEKNAKVHPYLMAVAGTGFIGSFTTFSTFSVENIKLLETGHTAIAVFYILLSLIGGLFMSWLGFVLARRPRKRGEGRRA
ncbi:MULTISPECIES: fluoride efflux transporter CrcB [Fictibacillus]|uniref:Fluoride-specific ion channel FluC n=1 Tax=Fictibacillus terranigra TaxID=3058424 RepID=A0ABT8E7C6_9BACL|nr:fluoride efflux transporter CrcB [Fictibacillus sp. CENA-BCM004]MDN4073817.1 fluoride efflux transporter CrcB [Fictibacillus sp. CENA-BCM004]